MDEVQTIQLSSTVIETLLRRVDEHKRDAGMRLVTICPTAGGWMAIMERDQKQAEATAERSEPSPPNESVAHPIVKGEPGFFQDTYQFKAENGGVVLQVDIAKESSGAVELPIVRFWFEHAIGSHAVDIPMAQWIEFEAWQRLGRPSWLSEHQKG